jgi:hypothetical protein
VYGKTPPMMNKHLAKPTIFAGAVCAALASALVLLWASPSQAADKWQFSATPYLWLPNINGHLGFNVSSLPGNGANITCMPDCEANVQVGPNSYLTHLNSAFMLAADARLGRWDVATDIINTNLSSSIGTVHDFTGPFGHINIPFAVSTSSRMTGTIWTLEGGYSVFQDKMFNADFIGGFRSTSLTLRTDYSFGGPFGIFARSGSLAANSGPFDWIVGLKGRLNLTDKLYVPYYVDAGSGTNSSTAQEIIGVGYGRNASAELLFRNLAYTSTNTALKSVYMGGPALGYTFRF